MKNEVVSTWIEAKVKKKIVTMSKKAKRTVSYTVNSLLKKALNIK